MSPSIERKLVDTLFQQSGTLLVGGLVYAVLGLLGFFGTGSPWYLAASGATGAICAARLRLNQVYARARDTASPAIWAWRALLGAWSCGAAWGAWSAAIVFEPDRNLLIGITATLCTSVIGGAVRSCAVPAVAYGQIVMTLVPMTAAFLAAGNVYLTFFAISCLLHIAASLGLARYLHDQTLRLLLQDEEKSDLVASLEEAKRDLETLAAMDALTGVANRRTFDLESQREWRRSGRERKPMGMLLLDIDHFKKFNDFYGHQSGDACLREVAAAICQAIRRPGDRLARYGGEEFAVILPDTDLGGVAELGADIVRAVEARAIPHDDSPFGVVTVSVGAACATARPGTAVSQLTGQADAALYAAKRSGRNRVHRAEAEPLPTTV